MSKPKNRDKTELVFYSLPERWQGRECGGGFTLKKGTPELVGLALQWLPLPRLFDIAKPTFDQWLETASKNPAWPNVERKLLALRDRDQSTQNDPDFSLLVSRVLTACYAAAHFDEFGKQNSNKSKRDRDAAFKKRQKSIAVSAATLSKAFTDFPSELCRAVPANFSVRRRDGEPEQWTAPNFAQLMSAIADAVPQLAAPPPGSARPWIQFACLEITGARKSPNVSTALIFNLVLLFREWTSGLRRVHGWQVRMPTTGEPHYSIAAGLAAIALNEAPVSDRGAENQVANLTGADRPPVFLTPWKGVLDTKNRF